MEVENEELTKAERESLTRLSLEEVRSLVTPVMLC